MAGTSHPLSPYLIVAGAADAITWYGDVLGAVEALRYTGDDGRVGHAELDLGGARVLLADEFPELDLLGPVARGGSTVSLHLEVADVDATWERALAAGARGERPPADEPFGARMATLVDPFGHRWMVWHPTGEPTAQDGEVELEGTTWVVERKGG